jgi:hypothetical protein
MSNIYKRMLIISCCVIALALLSIVGYQLIYKGYSNYQGYCSGLRDPLSEDRKINMAIKYLMQFYPKDETELRRFIRSSKGLAVSDTLNYAPVAYKSVEDFRKINKNCCRVLWQVVGVEDVPASLFDRIMGTKSSFVEIEYLLRYRDSVGVFYELNRRTVYPITNCGKVWN